MVRIIDHTCIFCYRAKQVQLKALDEYEKYRVEQDKNYISDFDCEVKKILESKKKCYEKY